ncbi:hypothetical protein NT04LS_1893a, partial [Listeria seeligeri FSL S4-171]
VLSYILLLTVPRSLSFHHLLQEKQVLPKNRRWKVVVLVLILKHILVVEIPQKNALLFERF